MSEHTKGPWHIDPNSNTVYVAPGFDKRIADVRGWGWLGDKPNGAEEQDANARLIAAAPDLLEALERLAGAVKDYAEYHGPSEDHHPDDCPDDDCPGCAMDLSVSGAINAARAAIAKARGTR